VTAVSSASVSLEPGAGSPAAVSAVYPEWDVHRRRYRDGWCTVTELPVDLDTAPVHGVPVNPRLRRALSRLGLELAPRAHELQGIDLDVDAVVAARVATMAGATPDERVYVDLLRRRRDLAVLVLLDVSGSSGEPSAAGGSVHDHQVDAAAQLLSTLERLGDRVALYAFRSQGRSAVHVLPVKRFADSFDLSATRRLAACRPGAYTRLGAAIRHGAALVDRDGGATRRLLVVLSDGFAYDHGYEGRYGEADARRALAEARRRGIGCLCLSIGAGTDPVALRRVFGTAAHACLPRVDRLPQVVGRLFGSALGSAEGRRRTYQHRVRGRERLEVERRSA
jgi:nitric oxide reductase activation protein